jgi:hypothetical protein
VRAFRSWIKQEVAALDWKLQHSPGLQMSSKRSSCSRDPPEKTNPVSLKIPFDS